MSYINDCQDEQMLLTSSSHGQSVVIQIGDDLLGQVVAEGQLGRVVVDRRPPAAPEPLEARGRRVDDRGQRQLPRRRRDATRGLLLEVRRLRHRLQVVGPDGLDPEPVRLESGFSGLVLWILERHRRRCWNRG